MHPCLLSIHLLLQGDPSPKQGSSWLGRGCPPPQGGDSRTARAQDAPLTLRLWGAASSRVRVPPSSSTPRGCVPEVGGLRGWGGPQGPLQGPLSSESRMVGSTQRAPGPGGARCPLRAARPPAGSRRSRLLLLLWSSSFFSSSSPRRLATAAARAGGAAVIPAPEEPALAGAWGSGRGGTRVAGVTQQVEPGPRPATRPSRASCSSLSPLSPPGQNPEHDGRQ